MKTEYEQMVIEGLSKITGISEKDINMSTSLKVLADKINVNMDGLLDRLCGELKMRVSNDHGASEVGHILIKESPHAWK